MQLETRRRVRPLDFSLTSVNIIFLLLLFFITAGTMMRTAEQAIEPPRTRELPLDRLPRPLLVIDTKGELFLDGAPASLDELADAGGATREGDGAAPLPVLHVLPDRQLAAERFLDIVKSIRQTGTWNITLVTIRE